MKKGWGDDGVIPTALNKHFDLVKFHLSEILREGPVSTRLKRKTRSYFNLVVSARSPEGFKIVLRDMRRELGEIMFTRVIAALKLDIFLAIP